MQISIHVYLKKAVLDPQGKAIEQALGNLGFDQTTNVRQGKMIIFDLPDTLSKEEALEKSEKMCETLLANQVMEDYDIVIKAA